MSEPSSRAAEQIKNGKPDRAHFVLDVVAENPKGPHIGYHVKPSAVQELMRQNWPKTVDWKANSESPVGMREPRRDKTEQIEKLLN